MPKTDSALILALTGDYFFIPRLQDAAESLGFELEIVENPAALGAEGDPVDRPIPLTEPLQGPDAAFVRAIVDLRPGLLLVDMSSREIPWERWIQILKTSSATRRIPVLAFGPHVETDWFDGAQRAGADKVVTRGQLQAALPELFQKHARVLDFSAMERACEGKLSELAAEGLKLLNSADYFEAHEQLELAWMEAPELEGYLYRALLQVSVAYLQVERGNYPGAVKMLLRLRQWLEPLPDQCRGVDVARLRSDIAEFSQALESVGEDGLMKLDSELLRPVSLIA